MLLLYNNWESITAGFQLLWQRNLITLSPTKHVINVSISKPFQQIQNPGTIRTYLETDRNTGDVFIAEGSNARGIWGRIWNTSSYIANILLMWKMWFEIKCVTLKVSLQIESPPSGGDKWLSCFQVVTVFVQRSEMLNVLQRRGQLYFEILLDVYDCKKPIYTHLKSAYLQFANKHKVTLCDFNTYWISQECNYYVSHL